MSRISPALRIAVVIGIAIIALSGCNIQELLGLEEEEDTGGSLITDPEAVAAMEVVGGLIEAILDGGGDPPAGQTFPDYDTGDYPPGISVTTTASSGSTVALDVTITDVVPEADGVPYDETYNGSADIAFTDNAAASTLTVEIDATMTVSGTDALFSSMSVEGGAAVYTYSATSLDLSAVTAGTLTVDGTPYDMTRIDVGGDGGTGGDTVSAADSHYFLMSYRIDANGVDRPQIVYSENGSTWSTNPIQLNGVGRLRAGVVNNQGRIVAVGTGGYVYWSNNGSEWTMVGSASVTTRDLFVVEFSNGVWIAAGNGVILRSPDGVSWTEAWTGGVEIHAVMYDAAKDTWVAAGAPPDTGVFSTDNGVTWTTSVADDANRPNQMIVELFATDDDTEWIALTGQPGSPGGILDGTDLEPADGDTDWVINSTGVTTAAYAVLAGAERDGVFVAMSQLNGTDATMLVSLDAGDIWSAHDVSGLPGWPVDITAIGNGFMGVTNRGGIVRGSADGQTWQVVTDESYGSYGVVFRP